MENNDKLKNIHWWRNIVNDKILHKKTIKNLSENSTISIVNDLNKFKRKHHHDRVGKNATSFNFINSSSRNNNKNSVSKGENGENVKSNNFIRYWKYYCQNTSVHGIRYLSEPGLHWTERITWTVIVTFATLGALYVSILLSDRYNTSPLSTVVENTYYHISEIPYPAVSICNNNRIDRDKKDIAIERFLKNATNDTLTSFDLLLDALEYLDFGSFDELSLLVERDFKSMEHINLTELELIVHHKCDDLLKKCWWRNKYYSCCDIFSMQKTEYGFCYSFNSISNVGNSFVNRTKDWPWRVASFGEWSGLRLLVNVKEVKPFNISRPSGLLIFVHHPFEWPNMANFIPAGTTTSIAIKPTAFYTSPDVRGLTAQQRQCIYEDEARQHPNDIMNLKGFSYIRANCMSECRQRHMMMYCNCSVEIFFPSGVYPACNITGMMCLNRYNGIVGNIFNYEKPQQQNVYFDANEEGISCPCLPECFRIDYGTETQPNLVTDSFHDEKFNSSITVDIHFRAGTMVRYRTDVTFGWLDLMVAFGGIAGLFLGCSLLSGAEMIYYLTIGLFWQNKRNKVIKATLKNFIDGISGYDDDDVDVTGNGGTKEGMIFFHNNYQRQQQQQQQYNNMFIKEWKNRAKIFATNGNKLIAGDLMIRSNK